MPPGAGKAIFSMSANRNSFLTAWILLLALLVPAAVFALETKPRERLDEAPDVSSDRAALSNGAVLFVDYCLGCHGLGLIRYNRLTELGITDRQIRSQLLSSSENVGEPVRVAARAPEMRQWFGIVPPDLSLAARARASAEGSGADWLYTYLRSFYRDENRPAGWNNALYPDSGMPHVFRLEQGVQELAADGRSLAVSQSGRLTREAFDRQMADLVGFLVWAGDPAAGVRRQLGVGVLAFLVVLSGVAYALKREYWKDVKNN